MTDTNEQKWREEFEELFPNLLFSYSPRGMRNEYRYNETQVTWEGFLAAKTSSHERILEIQRESDNHNKSFLNMFEQNEEKAKRILELENSDRIRFELVMSHGEEIQRLKGIAKEAIDDSLEGRAILILARDEIRSIKEKLTKRDKLLEQAKPYVEILFHEAVSKDFFLDLPNYEQWLKDYEELKNEQ